MDVQARACLYAWPMMYMQSCSQKCVRPCLCAQALARRRIVARRLAPCSWQFVSIWGVILGQCCHQHRHCFVRCDLLSGESFPVWEPGKLSPDREPGEPLALHGLFFLYQPAGPTDQKKKFPHPRQMKEFFLLSYYTPAAGRSLGQLLSNKNGHRWLLNSTGFCWTV